jgi:hypothetical protein
MTLMVAGVLASAGVSQADQYWVAYEGNDFPEHIGWQRFSSNPPAMRWLEDGTLLLDSRKMLGISDSYGFARPQAIDPGPGEHFLASWRLRIDAVRSRDPGVVIMSDDARAVIFAYAEGNVINAFEPGMRVEFEPGVFHEFAFRSDDMLAYQLYMDGVPVMEGFFSPASSASAVAFGDIATSASLVAWDYVRFGVVPEPRGASFPPVMLALTTAGRRRHL